MDIKRTDVGVIIGRFQTDELHQAHLDLINHVLEKHDKVLIFLGVSPTLGNKKHPMDFITRKLMIEEKFGNKISAILPAKDQKSDFVWSSKIDEKIRDVFSMESITLYGSRDSFIPHYKGKFNVEELLPEVYMSATSVRESISKKTIASSEFRAGIIYSVYNQFPVVYSTVDVAIFNSKGEILLGKKPNEDQWRFIGGFVDITDESDEDAAKREGYEETGLELGNFQYMGSQKVEDWRYRGMKDRSIMTRFFKCEVIFGSPQPNDDIAALKWFKFEDGLEYQLVTEHQKLFKKLL